VDAKGNLWVRLQGSRLLRYRDRAFQNVLPGLRQAEVDVTAMCQGANGDILFAGLSTGTVRYSRGRFVTVAPAAKLHHVVLSLEETDDGKVWMGTNDAGVYYVSDERLYALRSGLSDRKINSLLAIDRRELWIGTDGGVERLNGTDLSRMDVPHALHGVQAFVIIRDRDSNVWLGTSTGLIRIDARGVSLIDRGDNGSTSPVTALFEDREGNLWVGTARGLERLRDSEPAARRTFSVHAAGGR
jgi:hypothetical protein